MEIQVEKQIDTIGAKKGDYVLVRSRNEGVNAGFLVENGIGYVILDRPRRLWYHEPKRKDLSWYEGVAESGLSENSKISCEASRKVIVEAYSVTPCTEEAKNSILNYPSHQQ